MSVWVEIFKTGTKGENRAGHAPRERVSWNFSNNVCSFAPLVTLHVSVWVEISRYYFNRCILKVTLHVSVWVEIILPIAYLKKSLSSRSTWACELKFPVTNSQKFITCHAPRERVSWNFLLTQIYQIIKGHAPRERVSWNGSLLTSMVMKSMSRSTWACELKLFTVFIGFVTDNVTLHVSVWVEMTKAFPILATLRSRSTWACELKSVFVLYR